MTKTDSIKHWMKQTKSLSFFLPDGPYGRPFDNQYFFKDVTEDEYGLSVYLSDEITLAFLGNLEIMKEDDKLIISGFSRFDFILESKINKSFIDGEVCIYRF